MIPVLIAQSQIETAAIEALKQAPGLVVALVMLILFLRRDAERDKSNTEERRDFTAALNKFSEAQNNVAVVLEGLKEQIKRK